MAKNRFEALSRMVLNNWHYISHRILSFHEGINFFTGHSGSGKSTVIDAMQIILYANTDGRGFFNKAAADDSDRNLIEYLRGMVNIGDNNEFSYIRNKNFSTTIVMELKRTDTEKCQCVGVVFDVETASNSYNRLFFWHEGSLWDNNYRLKNRAMTIEETKDYLQSHYTKEEYYCGSHNERFRKQLYDIYLGGLNQEKFPLLFKRAIPFRMNMKLEEFVKEYICMEQDVHIDDMQESVLQYGRMRKKITDTLEEIEVLDGLKTEYLEIDVKRKEARKNQYYADKLRIIGKKQEIKYLHDKTTADQETLIVKINSIDSIEEQIEDIRKKSEMLLKQITESGYERLIDQIKILNEKIEYYEKDKARYSQTVNRLKEWNDKDITYNTVLWGIEEFEDGTIGKDGIIKLQKDLNEMKKDIDEQYQEVKNELKKLKKEEEECTQELSLLKLGGKAYPKEVESARNYLIRRLSEETGREVKVDILADLLDIHDDRWRNAIEGYLGTNKLTLIVEPRYAKMAMEIYKELEPKQYFWVSVLDTEKVEEDEHKELEHSLSEEVRTVRSYVTAYIRFLLGKVIKCENIEELRKCRIGITDDCVLYHNYKIQRINPEYYTKGAYIGKASAKQRMKLLEERIMEITKQKEPFLKLKADAEKLCSLELLQQDAELYLEWQTASTKLKKHYSQKNEIKAKIEELKSQNVDQWEAERDALEKLRNQKVLEKEKTEKDKWSLEAGIKQRLAVITEEEEKLKELSDRLEAKKQLNLEESDEFEESFLKEKENLNRNTRPGKLADEFETKAENHKNDVEQEWKKLIEARGFYLKKYPNRSNLSISDEKNDKYDKLLNSLSCNDLEKYKTIAQEQAKEAVSHFQNDFIYKIRDAIKDALLRKDELNKVISKLDFGKDKYQFVIGRNKGDYGVYYDMFMDETLSVDPSKLSNNMDNQMNLFTMEHENNYGEQMNELVSIFLPPENATKEQLSEARKNMEKFADYRTYLSFDMQQIIHSENGVMKIGLGKMIRKNSGGEGQNPLYIALLASFAQAYRINLSPKLQRNPTIRLVVLDEAFSKMDSEKVASCIELIRGLGFQALISATNDKIQNYIENVDKTFVFANPDKKCISIQEFEKKDFSDLEYEEE